MNSTYIKRQLTLNKLGFPISKDVQEYIDLFNELIGDPNELKKEYGILYGKYNGYLYSKNDIKVFFYSEDEKNFFVDYDNVWSNFRIKFRFNFREVSDLFKIILEKLYNYNPTFVTGNNNLTKDYERN